MMRSDRRHFIPERDRKKIREKILNGAKRNTAEDGITFPEALCGDNLSVLQECAGAGAQKWPIMRKWHADESLVHKGYEELEFHSRCDFNPHMPECEDRAYLIGPKELVETDQEKYAMAVFADEEDTYGDAHPMKVRTRRLTAVSQKFREVPDGYKRRPAVQAKTWDVKFIPRKCDEEDDQDMKPQFVKVKNATVEAMMEIYKYSDGFFVTKINESKLVVKRKRRISQVLKNEICRQSMLRRNTTMEPEAEGIQPMQSDVLFSPLDASPVDPMRWLDQPLICITNATDESIVMSAVDVTRRHEPTVPEISHPMPAAEAAQIEAIAQQRSATSSSTGVSQRRFHKDGVPIGYNKRVSTLSEQSTGFTDEADTDTLVRRRSSGSLEEVISEVKFLPKVKSGTAPSKVKSATGPPNLKAAFAPGSARSSPIIQSATAPGDFSASPGVKPTIQKIARTPSPTLLILSEDAASKRPSTQLSSTGGKKKTTDEPRSSEQARNVMPDRLKHLVVAEDVVSGSSEEKKVSVKVKKHVQREKQQLSRPLNLDAMKAVHIRLSSGEKREAAKQQDAKSKKSEEKRQLRFRRVTESNAQEHVLHLPSFPATKSDAVPDVTSYEMESPKPPSKAAQPPEGKAAEHPEEKAKEATGPERREEHQEEFYRDVSESDRSSGIGSAWSHRRTVEQLRPRKSTSKDDKKKKLASEIKGKVKSLHESSDDSGPTSGSKREQPFAVKKQKQKLTGIPEMDIPDVEPLNMEQFESDEVSFEQRSKLLLTKSTKKKKQQRRTRTGDSAQSRSTTGMSTADTYGSLTDDIITSKLETPSIAEKGTIDKTKLRKSKTKVPDKSTISKLELYKHAMDKGMTRTEEIVHDLIDFDKPFKSSMHSIREEKKSPFQLGENLKYSDTDDDKKPPSPSTTHEASRVKTLSECDTIEEEVQRVGDLDLTLDMDDKPALRRKNTSDDRFKRFRLLDQDKRYKGKKRSSLRTKYGLYDASYFMQDGRRNSLNQDAPDEAMYTFGTASPAGNWPSVHEVGAQPRFHYPMELNKLTGLSPMEYLEQYTSIPSRRLGLYQRIFRNHAINKEIPITGMKRALDDMIVGTFSREDYTHILALVERHKAKTIPWDEFKLICCLTDRLMDDSAPPSAVTPMTDYLQVADSTTVLSMLREETCDLRLTNLLNAVASCQLSA